MTHTVRTLGWTMLVALAGIGPLLGCTGYVPDRGPGSDNWVSAGDIAVDPRTETSYVLRTAASAGTTNAVQRLFAVSADETTVRPVVDLTGLADVRVLFVSSGVLVMAEQPNTHDRVQVFDRTTLAPVVSRVEPARYWGTRTSPSGRFVAVADNDAPHPPIHVLDATTLAVQIVPHDGDWLEAMWLRQREELLAIVTYASPTPHARLLAWNADALVASGFQTDSSGLWPSPTLDVTLDQTTFDLWFSYTWIGVSPDDRYAVFPVIQPTVPGGPLDRHRLVVLDLADFSRRTIDDAYGPVGFTADGAAIVSYRYDTPAMGLSQPLGAHLLVVDTTTLAERVLEVPHDGLPQFFVTREGNWVLATIYSSTTSMSGMTVDTTTSLLYDLTTGATHVLGHPVGLGEHVSRVGHGELWIVDGNGLSRLALMSAALDPIALPFVPQHLNILPLHDRLVMDDARDATALRFFDPTALRVDGTATLR